MTDRENRIVKVMQAFAEGKTIEVKGHWDGASWHDSHGMSWDWENYDYRIKPEESDYLPYENSEEMRHDFVERYTAKPFWIWLTKKSDESACLVTSFYKYTVRVDDGIYTMKELLKEFVYSDGKPCGKVPEDY